MLLQIVLGVLGAMLVVMVAAWAFGLAVRNGGWTDVFWTFGTGATLIGAAVAAGAPLETSARQWLVCALVAIWTLRLGLYLARRVASHPEDARYAAFRESWGGRYPLFMLGVVLPQAGATALLSVSVVLAAGNAEANLGWRDVLAVVIFVIAIVGEGVADHQMKRFRADPANRGGVMDQGLWSRSRHPNYLFQWLGWFAYPAIALDLYRPETLLSLTAPVVMFVLLRFVSGVPPLEAAMLKSRGDLYREYQDRVGAFFPFRPS